MRVNSLNDVSSCFDESSENGVVLWRGTPDCQAAHVFLLQCLKCLCSNFLNELPQDTKILKGNISETISFVIGRKHRYGKLLPFPVNAFKPLSTISSSDIDIIWMAFGDTANDDLCIVQEVKCTANPNLSYADALIADYDKLFGTKINLTLHTRLQAIKNEVELKLMRPDPCIRIDQLAGTTPITSPRVNLVPTLVHEVNGADPATKMLAIRNTLCGKGWAPSAVESWAVGLTDLDRRLDRLALGKP